MLPNRLEGMSNATARTLSLTTLIDFVTGGVLLGLGIAMWRMTLPSETNLGAGGAVLLAAMVIFPLAGVILLLSSTGRMMGKSTGLQERSLARLIVIGSVAMLLKGLWMLVRLIIFRR